MADILSKMCDIKRAIYTCSSKWNPSKNDAVVPILKSRPHRLIRNFSKNLKFLTFFRRYSKCQFWCRKWHWTGGAKNNRLKRTRLKKWSNSKLFQYWFVTCQARHRFAARDQWFQSWCRCRLSCKYSTVKNCYKLYSIGDQIEQVHFKVKFTSLKFAMRKLGRWVFTFTKGTLY